MFPLPIFPFINLSSWPSNNNYYKFLTIVCVIHKLCIYDLFYNFISYIFVTEYLLPEFSIIYFIVFKSFQFWNHFLPFCWINSLCADTKSMMSIQFYFFVWNYIQELHKRCVTYSLSNFWMSLLHCAIYVYLSSLFCL